MPENTRNQKQCNLNPFSLQTPKALLVQRNHCIKYSTVTFYARDTFLRTSHNSRQVLKHICNSCHISWDSHYFNLCTYSKTLFLYSTTSSSHKIGPHYTDKGY